nr:myeloid-derived growth factor [Pogona vitticeps]
MAAPRLVSGRRLWEAVRAVVFLLPLLLLSAAGAEEASTAAEFDVRPGGMVHSFAQSLGDFTCSFTYAAQGGTNEQWQMSVGLSEDNLLFSCSVWRPQGKSYLFFTQFKAEVKGAKIEYAMAYSAAATGGQSDIPLKQEESHVTETAVAHREGKFRAELSKLVVVAKPAHVEL